MGDSISLFVNDSLIMNKQIKEEPTAIEVGRFAEQSALMIVNNQTETVAAFDLSEKGGTYRLKRILTVSNSCHKMRRQELFQFKP